jgi:NitT/TauT family transport system ATP-binding protein
MGKRISLNNISVVYEDRGRPFKALHNINLDIQPGEFVSIIGSSGCGKSTLLSVLEGLLLPTTGEAYVEEERIAGPGTERSVVFQSYSLFPWMTAAQNVSFALEQSQPTLTRKRRTQQAEQYLTEVGLKGFEHRYPKELSGGQQQRVAIARALAENGEVLLMDEPFGAIDAKNRAILQDLLLQLWEGEANHEHERKTVVFVTHDLDEALILSDRIILMEAHQQEGIPGHIRADFKINLPRPRHRLELLQNKDYLNLRSKLSEIFFTDAHEYERGE